MKIKWTLVAGILCAAVALAQMVMAMDKGAKLSPSQFSKDMNASMKLMDHKMSDATMDGNADHDFAAMMIPHHQGAVDMARIQP